MKLLIKLFLSHLLFVVHLVSAVGTNKKLNQTTNIEITIANDENQELNQTTNIEIWHYGKTMAKEWLIKINQIETKKYQKCYQHIMEHVEIVADLDQRISTCIICWLQVFGIRWRNQSDTSWECCWSSYIRKKYGGS